MSSALVCTSCTRGVQEWCNLFGRTPNWINHMFRYTFPFREN